MTASVAKRQYYANLSCGTVALTDVGDDSLEAASTQKVLTCTGHSAQEGDIIYFRTGKNKGIETLADAVGANTITLKDEAPFSVATGDSIQILRR